MGVVMCMVMGVRVGEEMIVGQMDNESVVSKSDWDYGREVLCRSVWSDLSVRDGE